MSEIAERAGEPGSALEEPRLRFFLQHRRQIREWMAIAAEVPAAVAEVLRTLAPELESRFLDRADVGVIDGLAGRADVGVGLYRLSWAGGQPPAPIVAVALGWDESKVDPEGAWPRTTRPWVGIHVAREDSAGPVETVLRHWMKDAAIKPPDYTRGSDWIAYRSLPAASEWWKDVPAWRASVVEALVAAWEACAPIVDRAVAQAALPSTRGA